MIKPADIFQKVRIAALVGALLSLGGCPALQLLQGGINPFAQFMGTPGGGSKGDDGTAVGPEVEIEKLTIVPQPDANNGTPLWVGVAVVYKNGPVSQLRTMDAKTFRNGGWEQLLRDYPQRVEIFYEDIVVGTGPVEMDINRTGSKPIAGFVFVDYDSGGPHRLQLGSGEHLKLVLKKEKEYLSVVKD